MVLSLVAEILRDHIHIPPLANVMLILEQVLRNQEMMRAHLHQLIVQEHHLEMVGIVWKPETLQAVHMARQMVRIIDM